MNKKGKLSEIDERSIERVQWIIDSYCGGSQQELADRTGVNKASISQYLNRHNTPSNLTASKLAEPFGLSPAWVMGFDVPMQADKDNFRQKMFDEDHVLFDYTHLSDESKKTVRSIIDALKAQENNSNP